MIECPIHKVARIDNPLATNECQTCEYFNDCFEMMLSDMSEETQKLWAKYIKEMQDTVREHLVKKVKEGANVET